MENPDRSAVVDVRHTDSRNYTTSGEPVRSKVEKQKLVADEAVVVMEFL